MCDHQVDRLLRKETSIRRRSKFFGAAEVVLLSMGFGDRQQETKQENWKVSHTTNLLSFNGIGGVGIVGGGRIGYNKEVVVRTNSKGAKRHSKLAQVFNSSS